MRLYEGDVICIDLDEVLAINHDIWIPYIESKADEHGHVMRGMKKEDGVRFGLPNRICETCSSFLFGDPDIILSYPAREGTTEMFRSLQQLGLRSVIITHRPPSVEEATFLWFDKVGVIPFLSDIIVTQQPKDGIALKLGAKIMLDDKGETLELFENTPTLPILFDAPWNRHFEQFRRVFSLEEFTSIVRSLL